MITVETFARLLAGLVKRSSTWKHAPREIYDLHVDETAAESGEPFPWALGRYPVPHIGAVREDGDPVAGRLGYREDDVPIWNLAQKEIIVLRGPVRRLRPYHFIHRRYPPGVPIFLA